jgi:methyl-branched lipid omega-hydroxylase
MGTQSSVLDARSLGYVSFWAQPVEARERVFEQLRQEGGPTWFPLPKVPLTKSGGGAWALTTHEEVTEASRDARLFSSAPSAVSWAELPAWLAPYFGSMINMDDPRHAQIRRVVSRAFTPRVLEKMEEDLQRRATRIVDEIQEHGPTDFVPQVAARLPVEVICDMMGIPAKRRPEILAWTNISLSYTDPEFNGNLARYDDDMTALDVIKSSARLVRAGHGLFAMAKRLGVERRRNPREDLTTRLVAAQDGEESLTPQELGSFFLLLVAAGNETTRNALAHAIHLFTTNPDQKALLLEDFEGRIAGAVEEVVRYSTPVIQFRRNVTRDCDFHGRRLRRGDKVILFYNSANRDAAVFDDPNRFDILREPNKHVGFGGPGPHHCLGAHLARRELTVMLRELFTRMPDIRTVGEPDMLQSYFINGIKHMNYAIEPEMRS